MGRRVAAVVGRDLRITVIVFNMGVFANGIISETQRRGIGVRGSRQHGMRCNAAFGVLHMLWTVHSYAPCCLPPMRTQPPSAPLARRSPRLRLSSLT